MKKQLACMLAIAMISSMSPAVFADVKNGEINQDISGDNGVNTPIYNYQVPATLEFAVDKFMKADSSGSQIYSPSFPIINMSDVPIKASVKAKLTAKAGAGVTNPITDLDAKETPAEVTVNDMSNSKHEIYMEIVPANGVGTTEVTPSAQPAGKATRPVIDSKSVASNAVTYAAGSGSADTMTLDLAGIVVKDCGAGGQEYTLKVVDGSGNIVGTAKSGAVTGVTVGPAAPSLTEVATGFNTKKIIITTDDATNPTREYTIANTGSALTLTSGNAAGGDFTTPPTGLTFVLAPDNGTDAVVEFDQGAVTYQGYVVANGGSGASVKAPIDDAAFGKTLNFVLAKGIYDGSYDNDAPGTGTLFTGVDASDKGVGSFRFMGTVNPNATWEADKLTVTLNYNVSGIMADSYTAFDTGTPGEIGARATDVKNVMVPTPDPEAPSATAALAADGTLTVNYSLGVGSLAAASFKSASITTAALGNATTDLVSGLAGTLDTTTQTITVASANSYLDTGSNTITLTFVMSDNTETTVTATVTK